MWTAATSWRTILHSQQQPIHAPPHVICGAPALLPVWERTMSYLSVTKTTIHCLMQLYSRKTHRFRGKIHSLHFYQKLKRRNHGLTEAETYQRLRNMLPFQKGLPQQGHFRARTFLHLQQCTSRRVRRPKMTQANGLWSTQAKRHPDFQTAQKSG